MMVGIQVAIRDGLTVGVLALAQAACAGSASEGDGGGGSAAGGNAAGGSAAGGSAAGGSPAAGATSGGAAAGDSPGGGNGTTAGGASDWPAECFPATATQAGEAAFMGPAGIASFGEPAQMGEAMRVRLNGFEVTFDRFDVSERSVSGYGFDGGVSLTVPRSEVGKYRCPEATIRYSNQSTGPREFNDMSSEACCSIEITRVGPLGEPIEGTFSGVLYNGSNTIWAAAAEGEFTVLNRGGGAGGFGGTGNGF